MSTTLYSHCSHWGPYCKWTSILPLWIKSSEGTLSIGL